MRSLSSVVYSRRLSRPMHRKEATWKHEGREISWNECTDIPIDCICRYVLWSSRCRKCYACYVSLCGLLREIESLIGTLIDPTFLWSFPFILRHTLKSAFSSALVCCFTESPPRPSLQALARKRWRFLYWDYERCFILLRTHGQ